MAKKVGIFILVLLALLCFVEVCSAMSFNEYKDQSSLSDLKRKRNFTKEIIKMGENIHMAKTLEAINQKQMNTKAAQEAKERELDNQSVHPSMRGKPIHKRTPKRSHK